MNRALRGVVVAGLGVVEAGVGVLQVAGEADVLVVGDGQFGVAAVGIRGGDGAAGALLCGDLAPGVVFGAAVDGALLGIRVAIGVLSASFRY